MIGLIAAGAVLLVAAGIVATVLLLRKRKNREQSDLSDDPPDHEMLDEQGFLVDPDDQFSAVTQVNQMCSMETWGEM
jgi:cell division septation protein DedD